MSCENPPGSTTEEAVMPRRPRFDKKGICIKCKTAAGQLVIRHTPYCKDCFVSHIITKFRSVLDPTLKSAAGPPRGHLKAKGNLIVGVSGGVGSAVLLDLVRKCYFEKPDPKMVKGGKKHPWKSGDVWEKVIICYVDCSEAYEGVPDRIDEVKAVYERYSDIFEFLPLKLQDAFDPSSDTDITADLSREDLPLSSHPSPSTTSTSRLKSYLSSLPTPTSHQSTLTTLLRLLLLRIARTHNCSHLLFGTSLTSLSVNLIDAIASGAGFTIGLEKGEEWQYGAGEDEVVKLVRPLREVTMKECAAFLHWRGLGLQVVGNKRVVNKRVEVKAGIGSLTKDFIYGLERDYPSTVSAIVRTCNKLVSNTSGEKCAFCERPAQPGVQAWKERISTRSFNPPDPASPPPPSSSPSPLEPHLCYACHTTLTSRSSRGTRKLESQGNDVKHVPLPVWVGENVQEVIQTRHLGRDEMEAAIGDFLVGR